MARRSVTIVASDGKREGISWYDGATEAAVLRCARLALGISAERTAHLLWKSGDIVDFGKPIADGATLYLDTTSAGQHSDGIVVADGSRSSPPFEISREGAGGLSQRRVQPPPCEHESGDSDNSDARRPTVLATNSLQHRRLQRTLGESDTDRNSDDERRPLLSLLPSRLRSPEDGQGWGLGESSPEGQRRTILKMKRVNAHLANERTFLAWVRVMQKMFTAGGLSIELAVKGGAYGVCFVVLGLAYIALCPLIVFIGGNRYHKVAAVMQSSVHDNYKFFTGRDARGTNFVMCFLALLTVGVMITEMLVET